MSNITWVEIRVSEDEEGYLISTVKDRDGKTVSEGILTEKEPYAAVVKGIVGETASIDAVADEGYMVSEYASIIDAGGGETKKQDVGFEKNRFAEFECEAQFDAERIFRIDFKPIDFVEEEDSEETSEKEAETEIRRNDGIEIETEISIHAVDKRWRIMEIPIDYRQRPAGSVSKLNTFKDGIAVLRMIGSLFKDYRPLALFTFLAVIFIALGLIIGIPVVNEYLDTGVVRRFPSAMLALGLVGTGLLAEASGLILDTTAKSSRKDYELRVIEAYELYPLPKTKESTPDPLQ